MARKSGCGRSHSHGRGGRRFARAGLLGAAGATLALHTSASNWRSTPGPLAHSSLLLSFRPFRLQLVDLDKLVADAASEAESSSQTHKAKDGFSRTVAAGLRGSSAAVVASMLAAVLLPTFNSVLNGASMAQTWAESSAASTARYMCRLLPHYLLKFGAFELIYGMTSDRGVLAGVLFSLLSHPVYVYRFRMTVRTMNCHMVAPSPQDALLPNLARDVIFGWARTCVGYGLHSLLVPECKFARAAVYGFVACLATVLASPCSEWRGYVLQPPQWKQPFRVWFQPQMYIRSTGVDATIVGFSYFSAFLLAPSDEAFEHGLARSIVVMLLALLGSVLAAVFYLRHRHSREETEEKLTLL